MITFLTKHIMIKVTKLQMIGEERPRLPMANKNILESNWQ